MERLKALRTQRGLLQKEVAEKIGVDRTTYVKYEKGSSDPNFEILQRLADYFNVTVDYLLGYKGRSEMSDLFKHSLRKALERIDNYGDLTEPEAKADYTEAMGYAESQYVLTIDEIFRASDIVGESIDDMLSEDFKPGMREGIKESPDEEKTASEDLMNEQIMTFVRKLPEEQKILLLSLLQTTVERNQGMLPSVQMSTSGEGTKFERQYRTW